jgi:release factor glutamine methyltransferase
MEHHPKSGSTPWNIVKLLKWTTSYFKSHGIDSPRATAEILLAHILKLKRIDLYLRYDQPLCSDELTRFKALIKRRVNREPVAYIVGVKEFWSMDFIVTSKVLIPRPETECLVEAAISVLQQNSKQNAKDKSRRVLELGTGSGAIILALASQCTEHLFFASDRSLQAVALAQENAGRHGLDKAVDFFCGDWLTALSDDRHRFDMIISNPPYIRTRAIGRLQPEIYKFEPIAALDGDEDGLLCLRLIIDSAYRYLNPGGSLILEIGHDQKTDVKKIIDRCGNYEKIVFKKDYSGWDRVVQMQKKPYLIEKR